MSAVGFESSTCDAGISGVCVSLGFVRIQDLVTRKFQMCALSRVYLLSGSWDAGMNVV